MRYCLEIDLVRSSKARDEYYKILGVPNCKQEQKTLLIENKRAIKKRENILKVLSKLKPIHYPESYTKIINAVIKDITDY